MKTKKEQMCKMITVKILSPFFMRKREREREMEQSFTSGSNMREIQIQTFRIIEAI